jgi:hypothetical protein
MSMDILRMKKNASFLSRGVTTSVEDLEKVEKLMKKAATGTTP